MKTLFSTEVAQFAWLHYVESNGSGLCHVCILATKQKNASGNWLDQFTTCVTGKML